MDGTSLALYQKMSLTSHYSGDLWSPQIYGQESRPTAHEIQPAEHRHGAGRLELAKSTRTAGALVPMHEGRYPCNRLLNISSLQVLMAFVALASEQGISTVRTYRTL
jgi:hypothetical protein